jgi:hypothetical protein
MDQKLELKYGDLVLCTITITQQRWVRLQMSQQETYQPAVSKDIEDLAHNLITAGTSLLTTSALLQEVDKNESLTITPSPTLTELHARVKELALPPTPASRFARSLMDGMFTYVQEHFAESGIDLDNLPSVKCNKGEDA